MAKPRSPKKSTEVKEPAPNTYSSPAPNASAGAANVSSSVAVVEPETPETRTETRKTARRPEIVRSETRANLVPINVEDEVRRLAYLMAERRGFEPGHEAEDWLTAEREIRQRYRQQSA